MNNIYINLLLFTFYFPYVISFYSFYQKSTSFPHFAITKNTNAHNTNTITNEDMVLRKIDKWACIKNCGACCKLGPLDSRPDLETYLNPDQFQQYKSMIGEDNWCINFDKTNRLCKIYDTRPDFCIVDPVKYQKVYDVEADDVNDFCAFCCTENIIDVYGEDSDELERFEDIIEMLQT